MYTFIQPYINTDITYRSNKRAVMFLNPDEKGYRVVWCCENNIKKTFKHLILIIA